MPKKSTLRVHKPELLDAVDRAQSRSLPDFELGQSLPVFSRHTMRRLPPPTATPIFHPGHTDPDNLSKQTTKLTGEKASDPNCQAIQELRSCRELDTPKLDELPVHSLEASRQLNLVSRTRMMASHPP